MTREDIQKGKTVYYARILKPVGIYEVSELHIRTVEDDYFSGVDKHDKHAYLFSYNSLDKLIFAKRQECLDVVLEAETNAPKVSNEQSYEEYQEVIDIGYLYDKFKGQYRILCPVNKGTNDFNRKLNGTLEDIDCYISCQNGNKVFHYGGNTLQAYIPSLIRGHNILKVIDSSLIYDIEETDSEVLFKFKYTNSDKIIPLLKPKTNGSLISPFSPKNLPSSNFKIPDDKLTQYKEIVAKISPDKLLSIGRITNLFLQNLVTKKNTWENIRSDMRLKCVKGKEYIYLIGKWNEYLVFLNDKIKELQMRKARSVKVDKAVTKNKLLDYGFRYKENGDYRLYVPVYKWNGKTTVYAYFYVNIEENIFTYDIRSEGSTYFPYYNEVSSDVNKVITKRINSEITNLIKKGILSK